ncbi:MAG: CHASE domain-containing protein [Magnetococcales bacterium]|nr:CHASE domain-containing protein [Magnetococcales bacterium]
MRHYVFPPHPPTPSPTRGEGEYVAARKLFQLFLAVILAMVLAAKSVAAALELTTAEQEWLQQHPRLRHAPDPDYAPFESRSGDGSIEGIATDTLQRVAQILGVRVETVATGSWAQSLEMVKNRAADLVTVATPTPERQSFLNFTKPYAIFPDLLLVRQNVPGRIDLSQMSGKTLAVIKGWAINESLQHEYPDIRLHWLPDVKQAMTAVSLGEVDGVLLNRATAGYWAQRLNITNLRSARETHFIYRLSFAVRKDWPLLQSVIDKALGQISVEEQRRIHARWITLPEEGGDSAIPSWWWLVAAILLLLLGGLLWLNHRLRMQVTRLINVADQERLTVEVGQPLRSEWLIAQLPWLVLLVGLGVSYFWYHATKKDSYQQLQDRFDHQANEVVVSIQQRMAAYEQTLRAIRGLFVSSESVERHEFHQFVEELQLSQHLPGIQVVGFAPLLRAVEKEAHIDTLRQQGFPDYTIQPPGERDLYAAVAYLEPVTERNLRALGYDMYTEPVRREAMERARDSGGAALSGRVTLVQEDDQHGQAGVLMYLPVYGHAAPCATVEQRRASLIGWIYAAFRMDDLMIGTLGGRYLTDIDLEIFDGSEILPAALMYDSDAVLESNRVVVAFYKNHQYIDFMERRWTVVLHSEPWFEARLDLQRPLVVLYASLLSSLLLSLLVWLMIHGRRQTVRLARQMTIELRESKFRWQFALEGSGDGLWDWDIPAGTVFFSQRWKEMLGFTADEIGSSLNEWEGRIHPDDKADAMAAVQSHFDGKTPVYLSEHRVLCRDGSWKWILDRGMIVSRDATGRPLRMIGTHSDISEHKQTELALRQELDRNRQTEEALRRSNEFLEQLFNTTHLSIVFLDREFNFIRVNRSYAAACGHEPDFYSGKNHFDLYPHQENEAIFQQVVDTGMLFSITAKPFEFPDHPEWGVTYWDWTLYPVKGQYGDVEWLIFVLHEVTAAKRAELSLIQAKEQAEQATRVKGDFLSAMSHEIRTPMNVVLGMSSVLLETELTQEQRRYTEMMYNSGKALLGIINDILDFSRIEAGRLTLTEVPFAPVAVVTETVGIMQLSAEQKGLALAMEIEVNAADVVLGDDGRLRQVLVNLIGNAVKFTERGQITVALMTEPQRSDQLLFSVADTGIGIAADNVERIFDYFTQADAGITRRYGGTGLGLAISRRLVELMGGRLWVESQLGQGSTFFFTLPVRTVALPSLPVAAVAPITASVAGTLRILLVEDSEDNQALFRIYLSKTSHHLVMVNDGIEAVARVQREPFDLVLMDLQMPNMDGYTATRAIRQWEQQQGGATAMTIIALSAHASAEKKEESLAAGCNEHLTKPIKKQDLLAAIQQVARNRNL